MSNYSLVHLPKPVNTPEYFEQIKLLSEKYWKQIKIDKTIFGFQIQPNSKWKKGLSETELREFEKAMGFDFPLPLRNFYLTMNGLDKQGINVYGDSGEPASYQPVFYSFPDDLDAIKEKINWIYKENKTDLAKLQKQKASRIFPVVSHRFMLIDEPGQPILSMYGKDIIYWKDNLSKVVATEIFPDIENEHDFINISEKKRWAKFWLE
ncbi:MAG TPA: SMI1/KNR4 family protein [Bacteroidia bacterium]|nr:SMI1/KNR4 family protein [Bacteroidia bacterium]